MEAAAFLKISLPEEETETDTTMRHPKRNTSGWQQQRRRRRIKKPDPAEIVLAQRNAVETVPDTFNSTPPL